MNEEPSWGGCVLPVAVLAFFLGLGTCAVMTGVMQHRALAEFVDQSALVLEPLQPEPAAVARAKAAAEQIRKAAEAGTEAEVPLTVEILNTWIATSPWLETYRTTARVRSILPQGLVAEMSQELRGKRFLNGTFRFTVARSETNTWQLMLEDIDVPGRTVPPAFIQNYRNLHMYRFDADLPELQAVLKRISGMRLEQDRLVISIAAVPVDP
ncbi:MAG: hypothetical protein DVB23_001405 [Verrucomicrobia bacterium]|jgi:hypothetical protein|nr:MAG: hypothetical protein DVB23_001405 [Verrucomicrobiota bacterium]